MSYRSLECAIFGIYSDETQNRPVAKLCSPYSGLFFFGITNMIGPTCVLPCTQGSSDVSGDVRRRRPDATGDVRGTGPRDRAHARAPACQRGSCPTRDYATPRRCDLKPRSFESRAQYERMWTLVSNPLGTCVNPGT